MPQALMECLIHEKGFPCGPNRKERILPRPPGYVEWKDKLRSFKACAGYQPPSTWEDGEPNELTWGLLKRYPVSAPSPGDQDPLNPRGSGYYGVVRMDLADHADLYRNMQIEKVIPCKEQLHNRYDYEMVEAWPLDTLSIVPAAVESGLMPSIPEGVSWLGPGGRGDRRASGHGAGRVCGFFVRVGSLNVSAED